MKKQTATVSELIASLERIKVDAGDVKVYVVQASDAKEGDTVEFNGLSSTVAALKIVQGDENGILIFQSDEVLKP